MIGFFSSFLLFTFYFILFSYFILGFWHGWWRQVVPHTWLVCVCIYNVRADATVGKAVARCLIDRLNALLYYIILSTVMGVIFCLALNLQSREFYFLWRKSWLEWHVWRSHEAWHVFIATFWLHISWSFYCFVFSWRLRTFNRAAVNLWGVWRS